MTTIAWSRKHGIAADTLITSSGNVMGYAPKIGKIKGILYGAAGALPFASGFLSWARNGMDFQALPHMGSADCMAEGFIAYGGHILLMTRTGFSMVKTDVFVIGSGGEFALGALHAGKTPSQAVKIAMKIDCYTGGEIMSLTADE